MVTRHPMLSIVMPSYNQMNFIGSAIDSVFEQAYPNLELIVMDGASVDGTLGILRQKAKQYPRLRWTSESDRGPADALNKAFERVRGEYVGWLNSDDLFVPGAFDTVARTFSENPDLIMLYGNGEHINARGDKISAYPTRPPSVGIESFAAGCFICQPTVFFKRVMLNLLGPLDCELMTAFDYEYWLRAFQAFPDRIGFSREILAQSRLHDDCITRNMRAQVALEGLALGAKYLGGAKLHWATTYLEELKRSNPEPDGAFKHEARSFLAASRAYLSRDQLHQVRGELGL